MSITDELRRMLDERDVEWRDDSSVYGTRRTVWTVDGVTYVAAEVSGRLKVSGYLTPEQAIAATLGLGTCEYCKDGKFDGQTVMMSNHGWQRINFCPNCGRRVEQ